MKGKIRIDGRKSSNTNKGFPIIISLAKDKKQKLIRTGYYSKIKNWDDKNALPKKSHPDYINLLNYLELKKIALAKLLDEAKGKNINFHYAERYLNKNNSSIFYKEGLKLADKWGRTYKIALNSFNSFFPDYTFEMIDKKVVETYMDLLLNTPTKNGGNERSPNGVISYMNTLTAAWNKLDKPNNPFSKIRPPEVRTKNKAFSVEDLIKVRDNDYTVHSNSKAGGVKNYLNYFMLCFYLGGIDLEALVRMRYDENVIDGRLEFNRKKGKVHVAVSNKIFPEAWEILNQYDCKPFLIPLVLENDYNSFIPNLSRDQFQNIKDSLGLSKKPYSKAPRYSFITRAQQLLIDQRICEEIVGHSRQSTHSIYMDFYPYEVRDAAHKKIITLE